VFKEGKKKVFRSGWEGKELRTKRKTNFHGNLRYRDREVRIKEVEGIIKKKRAFCQSGGKEPNAKWKVPTAGSTKLRKIT